MPLALGVFSDITVVAFAGGLGGHISVTSRTSPSGDWQNLGGYHKGVYDRRLRCMCTGKTDQREAYTHTAPKKGLDPFVPLPYFILPRRDRFPSHQTTRTRERNYVTIK